MTLNQGIFKLQGKDFNLKRRFSPKEDVEWKLDRTLSGLGSIGQRIISKYFWAFLQGFEDKTKEKMMYKMTKRLLME
jgi:hypothetical protein